MSLAAFVILATGLVPGADPPNPAKAKANESTFYAKVEIRGWLNGLGNRWESTYVTVPKRASIPLNFSNLQGWTGEQLAKINGKEIRVTGTLEQMRFEARPGDFQEGLVVVVKTLELIEPDRVPAPKQP